MKFAYYLVFALWYLLSLLPLRVLYFFSDLLYIPLYYGVRYRRNIVRKNLVGSFPEKSQDPCSLGNILQCTHVSHPSNDRPRNVSAIIFAGNI